MLFLQLLSVHDLRILGEHPSWHPIATAMTNAEVVIDRFARHRDSAIHQENPLVAQSIWEGCRPSQRGRSDSLSADRPYLPNVNKSVLDLEQEWSDTYALICNDGVPAFPAVRASARAAVPGRLSLLQRLCIATAMRGGDGPFQQGFGWSRRHRDYIFQATHSLKKELCMVLQSRYFLLLDVDFYNATSLEDVVREISLDEFQARTIPWAHPLYPFDPSRCVVAHEVAFAPKGDAGANVSIWFDARPIELAPSAIKDIRRLKQQAKANAKSGHARPHKDGALIARRCRAIDFPDAPPNEAPFVPMLPAEDNDNVHRFVLAIMEHGIDSLILRSRPFVDKGQEDELYERMVELQEKFFGMSMFHEKWTWPKREGMAQVTVTTRAPPNNSE